MFASRLDDSYDVEVRRALDPLTLAKIGANSAYRFAPPFIATIASGLDVGIPTIGKAIAVGEIVGLSAPLLTRLTNRLTRRTAICSGLLGIGAATTVCATSHNAVQFAIGLALMSMTKIVFDVGIIAWLTDRVPYAQLGRPLGLTETAWAGGLFIGVVTMGLVTNATSWRWGYGVAIIAILFLAAMLRARLPAEAHRTVAIATADSLTDAAPKPRPRLGIGWWVIVGTMALTASAQSVFVTFGKWLSDDFLFTDAQLAAFVFALGAVELIATSTTVRFADLWGKQRSTMFGALLIVPAAIVLALWHDHLTVGLLALALYIGAFEFAIVSSLSLASNLIPGHATAGLGYNVGAGTLGRALMAPIATTAFAGHGLWLPATIGGGCASVTVLCQWRYGLARTQALSPV